MRFFNFILTFMALFATASIAQEETVLQKPSGDSVMVRTDSTGTSVTETGAAAKPAVGTEVNASGGGRHHQKVDQLTREGATITSESKDAK
jgi:hypothetical protein